MAEQKYNFEKVRTLADLRQVANTTQQQAAKYFDLKNRNSIAAWELGYGKPHRKLRSKFIMYLWDKLNLRRHSKEFRQIWDDLMVDEWGWDPLNSGEYPGAKNKVQDTLINEDRGDILPRTSHLTMNERLSIAGIVTDMIVLTWDKYGPQQIRCTYNDEEILWPPDILRLREEFINDCNERAARGETHLPYNSLTYKLKSFDVGYRDIINGEEIPVLYFSFGPTDYFTHRMTDLNVRSPVRDKYMQRAKDITTFPVPEFATTLGINLNLITKEGYLIMTERSLRTETEPGTLHTSVGEGLLRPLDAGPDGAPDPFRCAIRGTLEELGIELKPENIEYNAFCVHAERGQYSLFGWSRIKETQAEVELLRALAVPKDKWENRSLLFIPCTLNAMAQFMAGTRDRWSATGLAAAIFSLMQVGYTVPEIREAFSRTNIPL
jgi:hypothetical protein